MSGRKRLIAAAGGIEDRLRDLWDRSQHAESRPERRTARRAYERVLAAYLEQQRQEGRRRKRERAHRSKKA